MIPQLPINELIEELQSRYKESKPLSDYLFFQGIIKNILNITLNKIVYFRGVRFYGSYECNVLDHKLSLHFNDGRFTHLTNLAESFTQTFNKSTFNKTIEGL